MDARARLPESFIMARSPVWSALVFLLTAPALADDPAGRVSFESEIRPIFTARCGACHGPETRKAGLRLDRKASALRGGDEGAAIEPGDGENSLIVMLVSGEDPDRVMPPKGERLSPAQVAALKAWIDQGAEWPEEGDDPRSWWSLLPLERPAVPAPPSFPEAPAPRNPIDAFVRAKLAEKGLKPSPEADRRVLARRLYFDLIGLPPSPEEVAAFVADADPMAYENLVDRLLASPSHGERWARHWLDVAHYGDSHGYDKDKPRPNAWPYRDYVVRALNADKPFDRFVAEQVAGDALYPDDPDAVAALGFLAAGPWDFVGHAEVPETKSDGKVARHLDRDDMARTVVDTFLGLTAGCAQCHDHKFDPISQEDYYRLQAVFAAVDRADRPLYADPAAARKARELFARRADADRERDRLAAAIAAEGGPALVELDRLVAAATSPADRPEFGYHSALAPSDDDAKWAQADLGGPVEIARVVLRPCRDDFNGIGDGFGFPVRYRVEASDDPTFESGVAVIADRSHDDEPNPGVSAIEFGAQATARYVRVTAVRLAERQNDYHFALAELEVFDRAGANVAAGAPVSAKDSIEAPPRWRAANLVDGAAPGTTGGHPEALQAARESYLAKAVDPALLSALKEAEAELARIEAEQSTLPKPAMVYAATIHDGGDSPFRGTGPDGGRPRRIFLLDRGDVNRPLKEVGPGALGVFRELPGDLHVAPDRPESERRAALARWLVDDRNPLTWRVIVNRVWQYHFGRGIVATPSDFGKMGEPPTHPELLDWLAAEFRDGGRSLKSLHRLILTSAAYRQAAAGDPAAEAIDSGDAYLWRGHRRKLEAEAVRDSALAVSGLLDPTMYGPPFRNFVMERPEHSPHYEYELMRPDDPTIRRRAVYRFLARSRPEPFMTVLDCADPSMQVEKRGESVSPLQALALYNNGLMLVAAKALAARVEPAGDRRAQVARAFSLALAREPSAEELDGLDALAAEYGVADACRVILNMNEFIFVD
jgi:mono/diheme cytochrome c family protein